MYELCLAIDEDPPSFEQASPSLLPGRIFYRRPSSFESEIHIFIFIQNMNDILHIQKSTKLSKNFDNGL
jgi:hypothetical protein